MARPKKEIDQKQFENLCGLQCTLEEICGWFDVTDKTHWKHGANEPTRKVFRKFLHKSAERVKYHCGGVSGDWLKRTPQWRFSSVNSFWDSETTWT